MSKIDYESIKNGKCPNCGDQLRNENGAYTCPSCLSRFTIPKKETPPEALQYYVLGESERERAHFDEAYQNYKHATECAPNEPEAHFGMALSRHKIQFLKDFRTSDDGKEKYRMQPISFGTEVKKFSDDECYKKALSLATPEQKKVYSEKARDIDRIKEKFAELKAQGKDYGCFICVKVTDENGGYTDDCHEADNLYSYLEKEGCRPFYSERNMHSGEYTASDYEAVILYALYTARCMIVVCSNEKYLDTPWVKNEYTRFKKFIECREKKEDSIAIAFKGAAIQKLSIDDVNRQGIDLSKGYAYSTIKEFAELFGANGLNGPVLERKDYEGIKVSKKAVNALGIQKRRLEQIRGGRTPVSEEANLNVAKNLLSQGYYERVRGQCDKIIAENPGCSEAYWLRFLAEQDCADEGQFIGRNELKSPDFTSFEKAIASAPDKEAGKRYYDLLAKRVRERKDFDCYCEFIHLPDSEHRGMDELSDIMFAYARSKQNCKIFYEVIKTVEDADQYINWNMRFAESLPDLKMGEKTKCYRNVLQIDAAHFGAQWGLFGCTHGFSIKEIMDFFKRSENATEKAEEELFKYGFNDIAADHFYQASCAELASSPEESIALFDWLIRMIPKGRDELYKKYLTEFGNLLISHGNFDAARKYNDLLLAEDNLNEDGCFNKLLINNRLSNPLAILLCDKDWMNDDDFFNAMTEFSERHPHGENFYMSLVNEQKGILKTISDPQCREYAIQNIPVSKENLLSCKKSVMQALDARAQAIYADFLRKYNSKNALDLNRLEQDVTADPLLKEAHLFAKVTGNQTLLKTMDGIEAEQPRAVRYNVRSRKSRLFHSAFAILLVLAECCLCLIPGIGALSFMNVLHKEAGIIVSFVILLAVGMVYPICSLLRKLKVRGMRSAQVIAFLAFVLIEYAYNSASAKACSRLAIANAVGLLFCVLLTHLNRRKIKKSYSNLVAMYLPMGLSVLGSAGNVYLMDLVLRDSIVDISITEYISRYMSSANMTSYFCMAAIAFIAICELAGFIKMMWGMFVFLMLELLLSIVIIDRLSTSILSFFFVIFLVRFVYKLYQKWKEKA